MGGPEVSPGVLLSLCFIIYLRKENLILLIISNDFIFHKIFLCIWKDSVTNRETAQFSF